MIMVLQERKYFSGGIWPVMSSDALQFQPD